MNPDKTYLGTTEGKIEVKKRYNNHTNSFRHNGYSQDTTLSKYIWEIKKCLLYLHEKLEIVNFEDQDHLLNKRSELICKRRLANKYSLCNYKGND